MTVRLSVNVNDETQHALEDLAERKNTTVTEIVRRAVSVYKFIGPMIEKPGVIIRLVDIPKEP